MKNVSSPERKMMETEVAQYNYIIIIFFLFFSFFHTHYCIFYTIFMNLLTPLLFYCSFLYIMLSGEIIPAHIVLVFIELFGIILILWSSAYLGVRMFPVTFKRMTLVSSGPYALIRHPMYAGLLCISLSLVWDYPTLWNACVYGIQISAMIILIHYEELYLEKIYKSKFVRYKEKTKKILPFIY